MLAGTESDEATRAASELHAAIISTSNVEAPSTSFHPTVTSYKVQVSYHGEHWLVAKRYSEFAELNRTLTSVWRRQIALVSAEPLLNAADDVPTDIGARRLHAWSASRNCARAAGSAHSPRVDTEATRPTQLARRAVYDAERGAATLAAGCRGPTPPAAARACRGCGSRHQGSDESYAYEPFDVSSFGGGGARPETSVDESEAVSEWIAARAEGAT